MTASPWIPLTMKVMALGHTLRDAQQMAAVILIGRLVVYTLMGYGLPDEEPERIPSGLTIPRERSTGGLAEICGMFPARSGTAADSSCALLVTQ